MTIYIHTGCCLSILSTLPADSVDLCLTSPPYFQQRDYDQPGQLGQEPTPDEYVASLVAVFRHVRRVLKPTGLMFLNLGDKRRDKQLLGLPWRTALALQADGWLLRQECVWHVPNVMPESTKDRPTRAHEHVFMLSKQPTHYYDHEAVKEPLAPGSDVAYRAELRKGRQYDGKEAYRQNMPASFDLTGRTRRTVWEIPTKPFPGDHPAPMPEELAELCVKAGCPEGGTTLDPFAGAFTTALVSDRLGRHSVAVELNPAYVAVGRERLARDGGMFCEVVLAA